MNIFKMRCTPNRFTYTIGWIRPDGTLSLCGGHPHEITNIITAPLYQAAKLRDIRNK